MEFPFFILGAAFLYFAAKLRHALFTETRDWASVTATVTGYVQQPMSRTIHPVLRFSFGGEERFIKLGFGSRIPLYPLHGTVKVRVSPQEPRRYSVEAKTLVYFVHVFATLGFMFLCAGVLTFRSSPYSLLGLLFFLVPFFSIRRIPQVKAALKHVYGLVLFPPALTAEQGRALAYVPAEMITLALQRHLARARFLGVLMVLVSGGGFWAGEAWLRQRNDFLKTARSAEGEVVRLHVSHSRNGSSYSPIVRFREPASNAPVEFRHRVGSNPPSYRVGEKVGVLYAPEKPTDAMIDGGGYWNFLGPLLVLFFSFVALVLGVKSLFA